MNCTPPPPPTNPIPQCGTSITSPLCPSLHTLNRGIRVRRLLLVDSKTSGSPAPKRTHHETYYVFEWGLPGLSCVQRHHHPYVPWPGPAHCAASRFSTALVLSLSRLLVQMLGFQHVTRVALANQTVHWHIGSVAAASYHDEMLSP